MDIRQQRQASWPVQKAGESAEFIRNRGYGWRTFVRAAGGTAAVLELDDARG